MRKITLLILVSIFVSTPFFANDKGMITIGKTPTPPTIDGKLIDACWKKHSIEITPFILNKMDRFAAEQTSVYMCYDADHLYMAFKCRESCLFPAENRLHEFKRETKVNDAKSIWKDDCIVIILMPENNRKQFFDIAVNGNGIINDAVCTAPNHWQSRNTIWNSKAKVAVNDENGFWTVEMATPLSSLGTYSLEKDWGILLGRIEKSRHEVSSWQPMKSGFHNPDEFGILKFTEKVPGISVRELPTFRTGKNCLKLRLESENQIFLRVSTDVQFTGAKPEKKWRDIKFSGTKEFTNDFSLDKNGDFTFRWIYENATSMKKYFSTPLYRMKLKCSNLTVNTITDNTEIFVNGSRTTKSAPLFKGKNCISIKSPGNLIGEFRIGDFKLKVDNTWKFSPSAEGNWHLTDYDDSKWEQANVENGCIQSPGYLRKYVLFNDSDIWPDWHKEGVSIPQGAVQQLIFNPKGFKGKKLNDYRIFIETPPEIEVAGVSGYYNIYKIELEDAGIVTRDNRKYRRYAACFKGKIKYQPQLPLYKRFIFVLRAPEDGKVSHNKLIYYCKADKGNIIEVPQTLKINILPELKGVQPDKLIIQMWPGWLKNLDRAELKKVIADMFVSAGVTESSALKHDKLKNFVMVNFKDWNLDCSPYVKTHPESVRVDFNGKKCFEGKKTGANICSTAIIEDDSAKEYLVEAFKKWKTKWNSPDNIVWDYEHQVFESYISCFCPRCLKKFSEEFKINETLTPQIIKKKYTREWTTFMNRQMAGIALVMNKCSKKVLPQSIFSVYSGYQSDRTKWHYGVDWSMLEGKIDLASCGYGRPLKNLKATKEALKDTPLMPGAIFHPHNVKEKFYPSYCTKAKFLRRLCDGNAGVLIYASKTLDGKSFYNIAELSRLLSTYQDMFITHKKTPELIEVKGLGSAQVEVLSKDEKRLVLLMNSSSKEKEFEIKNLELPENIKAIDFYSGKEITNPALISGTIEPNGIKVYYFEKTK